MAQYSFPNVKAFNFTNLILEGYVLAYNDFVSTNKVHLVQVFRNLTPKFTFLLIQQMIFIPVVL